MVEVKMSESEALMAVATLRASANDFVWPLATRMEKAVYRETEDVTAYAVETTEKVLDSVKSFLV